MSLLFFKYFILIGEGCRYYEFIFIQINDPFQYIISNSIKSHKFLQYYVMNITKTEFI
jgi:hypothetical protein